MASPVTSPTARRLHEGAWLCWAAAASISVFLTSNPLYLSLACLAGLAVYLAVPRGGRRQAYGVVLTVGLVLALLSVPFNVLTGASGPTVLARLPEASFPDWLGGVTFGGEVTGEALAYAGTRVLTLMALLLFVAAFNVGVDHFRLLRLAPAALFHAGVVATIAVLLLPQGLAHVRAVREAQRLRGQRLRGLRSLVGLAVPVLAGALERSIQRAESLDARGFGRLRAASAAADRLVAAAGLIGLVLAALGGFVYFYYSQSPAPGVAALGVGAGLVALAVYAQGRRLQRTCYSQQEWEAADRWVVSLSLASLALLLILRGVGAADLTYIPYPSLAAPGFNPAAALAFLLLLAPLVPLVAPEGGRLERAPATATIREHLR
jgi:energy-coupling factor transport system permease protein